MTSTKFDTKVQEPLVPANVILTSYTYVPIDIKFLTESDIAFLPGDAFKAAMQLLAKSWQETPAASLPDDDRLLAYLAGFGRGPSAAAEWAAVKDDALSDFVLCSDGRYYSQTLAPKALEVWDKRRGRTDRTAPARAARADKRASKGSGSVTETVTTSVTEHKGKEMKGQEIKGDVEGAHIPVASIPDEDCPF